MFKRGLSLLSVVLKAGIDLFLCLGTNSQISVRVFGEND